MSRVSKILDHPDRASIERAIIKGKSNCQIARDYSKGGYELSREAVRRYREEMISKHLLREDLSTLEGLKEKIEGYYSELDNFISSILDTLRDKDGNISYSPRAEEITVTYTAKTESGTTIRDSAPLQELLDKISGAGDISLVKINNADPRLLLLRAIDRSTRYSALILKAFYSKSNIEDNYTPYPPGASGTVGDIADIARTALAPYPEAMEAFINALLAEAEKGDKLEAV